MFPFCKKSNKPKADKPKAAVKPSNPVRKFVIGSFLGFLGGVVITFILYFFLLNTAKCTLYKTTWITCILGVILTLGLAFNRNLRCTTCLILPNLCSTKGRSLLMAYAFFLAATGPSANIIHNMETLSKSFSCQQESLKAALKNFLDMMKNPIVALKKCIEMAMRELRVVLKKIEKVFKQIAKQIKNLVKSIEKCFSWLGNIFNMCDKEMGTPYDRCLAVAENGKADCEKKMGSLNKVCEATEFLHALCYTVKFLDAICVLTDAISSAIVDEIHRKLKRFQEEIDEMFRVSVKFEHDFYFTTKVSKNLSQIGNDVLADIKRKSQGIFFIFGWLDILTIFLGLKVFLKAMYYKYKYLAIDNFDNAFISKDFIEIDDKRKEMDLEVVLPLTRKENQKYIYLTSLTLVRSEALRVAKSVIFLVISTVQLSCICLLDYALYWILDLIRSIGRKQAGLEVKPLMTVDVDGKGYVAELYDGVIKAFRPSEKNFAVDPVPCLPNPRKPDINRYYHIAGIIILCWSFAILQPYFLRLRQVIMRTFYPGRAKERAGWLYNQILMNRTSFLTIARRQARNKFKKGGLKGENVYGWSDWFRAKANNYWILRKIFGTGNLKFCILCSTPFRNETDAIGCPNAGCQGKYCDECFKELSSICFLCNSPLSYGDLSDVSEESYSSDEFEDLTIQNYCN